MAVASTPRRGSFLETWRLFTTGSPRIWLTILVMLAALAMPAFAPHAKARFYFFAMLIVTSFSFATWHLEGEMGEQTAFMLLVPQPADVRWLVLVPMCTIGLIAAVGLAVIARLPAPAALAFLGVAWWAIAGTRWLWKLRFWPLFVLPILAAGPAVAGIVQRAGGWGPAAAVSLVLGIVALAFQPRPYLGVPVSRLLEKGGEGVARIRGAAQPLPIAAHSDRGWFASPMKFFHLTGPGPVLAILFMLVGTTVGVVTPFLGSATALLMQLPFYFQAKLMAKAYSGGVQEFLAPLPFNDRQRFLGGLAVPLLSVLFIPALASCFVNRELVDAGGVIGKLFTHRPPHADDIRYLREVLGATFLPDKWPASGLPLDLWQRLRPLLYLDLFRAALLLVAMMFAGAGAMVSAAGEDSNRRSVPKMSVAITLAVFAVAVVNSHIRKSSWPVAPTWLVVLVCAASIAQWARRVRAVRAPVRVEA